MKLSSVLAFGLILVLVAPANSNAYPVTDTGQTKCYNTSVEIPCPSPGEAFYGQDAAYSINMPNFTKLDGEGNPLPESATSWVMVRDNVTGLIWEVKTSGDGVGNYNDSHDPDNTYTWYNPDDIYPGYPSNGTDTNDFLNILNNSNFGGYSDWRIPTLEELCSIEFYGGENMPPVHATFFPNIKSYFYWSSVSCAFDTNSAWGVNFNYGTASYYDKVHGFYAIAVRDVNSTEPNNLFSPKTANTQLNSDNRYLDNGDGTISDTFTGLMWQKESYAETLSWESALSICEGLVFAGYDDWRLPTKKELAFLVDRANYNPSIDSLFSSETLSSFYWSSSNSPSLAWGVTFSDGGDAANDKIMKFHVRAVRGGYQPSSISGYVFLNDGVTPITSGMHLELFSGSPCESVEYHGAAYPQSDGSYLFTNVSPGTYYIKSEHTSDTNYIDEWWAEPLSLFGCNQAQAIEVGPGQNTEGKDFQLEPGAVVTGTVYLSDGITPVTGKQMWVYAVQGNVCGGWVFIEQANVDPNNGTYRLTGLPAGNYYLKTAASDTILNEWWAFPLSAVECTLAQSISVESGQSVVGKDFQLEVGATISGTVYEGDGVTPISGKYVLITVYSGSPCFDNQWIGNATVDEVTGSYSVTGLPPGTYQIYATTSDTYAYEWWASPESSGDCAKAQPIIVGPGEEVSGKNFQLDQEATISGTVFESDGVTPIIGKYFYILAFSGDPCENNQSLIGATVDEDTGSFTIKGLASGIYYIRTFSFDTYAYEWWAEPESSASCSAAQSITLGAGEAVLGKDFQLDRLGSISGTVYESDGVTPITADEIYVIAFSGDPCGSFYFEAGTSVNQGTGSYSISGLRQGTYYILSSSSSNVDYTDEWWAEPESSASCSAAQSITLGAGEAVLGKDFQLDQLSSISGTVFEDDGVTPITGRLLAVQVFSGDPCQSDQPVRSGYVDVSDGTYQILSLSPGSYHIALYSEDRIVPIWWSGLGGSLNCLESESVMLESGQYITAKNFLIDFSEPVTIPSPVPDTGQTQCFDLDSNVITCPAEGQSLYGQDASYAINTTSYTKLDVGGSVLSDSAESWVMVQDNVTGLVWEAKTAKDGVVNYNDHHDADNTYTWYDSNPLTNGGVFGVSGDETDTADFIRALNAMNFGGYSDWRLPTVKELAYLVHHGISDIEATIDPLFFSDTQPSFYWASTSVSSLPFVAWGIDFGDYQGYQGFYKTFNGGFVRAVRGGRTVSAFVDKGNGTVEDLSTGLMWQQAVSGEPMNWSQALSYCETMDLGDYTDWRMPTIKELRSLVNYNQSTPAIDTVYFTNTGNDFVWSSTTSVNGRKKVSHFRSSKLSHFSVS